MLTRNSSHSNDRPVQANTGGPPLDPSTADSSLVLRMNYTHPQLGVLTASGDLDSNTTPRLAALLWPRLQSKLSGIVLDFREVDFLCVAALELLVNACAYSAHRNVELSLVGDTPAVRRALRAAGIEDLLPRHSSVAEALGEHETAPTLPA